MKKFAIVSDFKGYTNKKDRTNIGDGFLVAGSQNVRLDDGERVVARQGYELDGAENTATTPIESSYVFLTSRGDEIALRSYDDELEFRQTLTTNQSRWFKLADGFSSVNFRYASYWDTAEFLDKVLMVNGTSNIYSWSGGLTTFASATSNTITKQGTTSWAEEGFLQTGTRQVTVDGTVYTYTGGEGTTTLTGVTPDPTVAGHAAGDIAFQTLITTANSSITSLPNTLDNDLIEVLDNQVWIASEDANDVYVSKQNDFTDFSFASPRIPGDGVLLHLNGTINAFVVQEGTDQAQFMYISAGDDQWYYSLLTLSADLVNETLQIKRLKTSPKSAARSQEAVGKIKNNVSFISNEPTFDLLGKVENIISPETTPLSDPIKIDFDTYDFTNCHVKFYRNAIYIAVPNESLVLIYNLEKRFWEAPQVLPVSRLAIIGGDLYGHSNVVPETYKLFTGYSDREIDGISGNPINCIAAFSYQNYSNRAWFKTFDEWYSEGYIEGGTTLSVQLNFDYTGSGRIQKHDISGSDNSIIFNLVPDGSIGKDSLGKNVLGGGGVGDAIPKFRIKKEMESTDFYEVQAIYSSNDVDQRWELLAMGPNVKISPNDDSSIKQ